MKGVAVECYSGHTYAQEPRRFVWQEVQYSVIRIDERWRTPSGPAFRVRTRPRACFMLQYLEQEDDWRIEAVPEGIRPDAKPAKLLVHPRRQVHHNEDETQGKGAHS